MVAVEPHYYGSKSYPRDGDQNRNGEGTWTPLRRFQADRTLRGALWIECCSCGFTHCYTFEVLKDPDGQKGLWWLIKRGYADETTRPATVTVRGKRKKK